MEIEILKYVLCQRKPRVLHLNFIFLKLFLLYFYVWYKLCEHTWIDVDIEWKKQNVKRNLNLTLNLTTKIIKSFCQSSKTNNWLNISERSIVELYFIRYFFIFCFTNFKNTWHQKINPTMKRTFLHFVRFPFVFRMFVNSQSFAKFFRIAWL